MSHDGYNKIVLEPPPILLHFSHPLEKRFETETRDKTRYDTQRRNEITSVRENQSASQ